MASSTYEMRHSNRSQLSQTFHNDAFLNTPLEENLPGEIEMRTLPPTDCGKEAYLVLLGCTIIQAPVWGYSLAFGVFQEYYTTHRGIKGSPGAIATVGTTLNGLMYLMMPFSFTILTRYPRLRRYCGPLGLVITVASLVLSSYATEVWQLIASQGVFCAIGSGLLYSPSTLYLNEWFVAKKGMAYGTIGAGKSAAGVIFPFIMSSLLTKYGPKTTLQAWAISLVILTLPILLFLKPRIPVSNSTNSKPLNWNFLKSELFWIFQLGNVIEAFGYLLPSTYLASYAHTVLVTKEITGAVLIAVLSFANVLGSLMHGVLQDHFSSSTVILVSTLGSTLSTLILWGLAKNLGVLVLFAVVYGFFAGGFSSTYPGIVNEMRMYDEGADTGLIMGFLLGGRGVGFVVGGPVSAVLLKTGWSVVREVGTLGYKTEYGPVILCTGATALFGGWGWMWKMGKKAVAC
ncbi:major facilitator superfamily domain-containing protein [Tricladium varicosporioides]|nr:major facilitator superfamily domain-containing protein [Hymenoscyphus varicosporioides]